VPQDTGSPEVAAALSQTGAGYAEARSAILSWDHPRRVAAITKLRLISTWEASLTADFIEGWIQHRAAFESVIDLLKDDQPGPKPMTGYTPPVRGKAIAGLGVPAVPAILELLWKQEGEVASSKAAALFVALTILKDSRALPLMRQILDQPRDPVWRRGAVMVLATLGDEALPEVVRAAGTGEKDTSVRTAALQGLHQFADPRAGAALLVALRDTSRTIGERRAAADSLYNLSDSDILRPITAWLLQENDEEILLTLVMLVGRLGTGSDIQTLERISARATDPVRQIIIRAVAEIRRRE
jgi:HEAT repeat protein